MASYTDKIPTFNPYVAQQPVEAMLKVGMAKQQKYEEGVQKIQTNIDNVAGLDIANPVQQKYLQSKLNALGNNLRFVAGGDFSDFSLVNSVNGMTKQIVKDETVINAVSSTATMRAGYKRKKELEKKGLTDKNNDDYYDKDVQAYVNSEDLNASFKSDYIQHTNIVKKLQEALVGVGESSTIAEQLFVVGDNGKPALDETGHYQYADVKTIDKLVTNKPAVLAAINSVMNEGDVKQQLGIDGWATYRGVEATTLLAPLKTQYDNDRDKLQQEAINNTALSIGSNLSEEDKNKYKQIGAEIEASLIENDKTFISLSQQAENSPEEFKQNYYTQDVKQNLMAQFGKEEISHTTAVNEGLQQQNWRQDYAFKEQKEKNDIAYQNQTLALAQDTANRGWAEFYGTFEKDPLTGQYNKKPEPGKLPKPRTLNANTPLFSGATSGEKVSAINILQNDIQTLTESKGDLSFTMYADLIRATNNDYTLSDEIILRTANKAAKAGGVTKEVYLDRWANNIVNKYDESGIKPPPGLGDQLNDFLTTSKSLTNKITMSASARIQADKEAGVDWAIMEPVLSKGATLNFNNEGKKYTLTPRDLLLLSNGMITANQLTGIDTKNLPNNLKNIMDDWQDFPPAMIQKIRVESFKYNDLRNHYGNKIAKANEIFNTKISKIVGVSDTTTGSLPMGDADEIKASTANVATYVNGGERSYGKGTTATKILAALNDATGISWVGKKPTNAKEDWTGTIKVSAKDGNVYIINDINHQELEQFTNLKLTNYEEKPIQDLINLNQNTKSTNSVYGPSSPKAWTTSYFKGNEASPEVAKAGWGYRADVVKTRGGYRLVNYLKVPGTAGYVTIYGNAIATEESTLDNIFKTTSPKDLENIYITYLQNQQK